MSNWMSSLIKAQDGCLQMVAQRATMGRVQQELLAQNVAQCAMMPSTSDQVSYLRAQLAHREVPARASPRRARQSLRPRRRGSSTYASTQQ